MSRLIAVPFGLGYESGMKNRVCALTIFAAALQSGTPAMAHPHIFVDTGLDLYFTAEGMLSEVRVTWSYDAFYSLLITQDMGIDLDGDGLLTDAEKAALQGFDMKWSPGFNGDLVIYAGNAEVPLSAPRDYSARFVLGRITTFHTRDVTDQNLSFDMLKIQPYDATYYTAYDVTYPVTLHGIEGCETQVQPPQQTADLTALRDQLSGLDPDADPADVGLDGAGALLATSVNVICAAS